MNEFIDLLKNATNIKSVKYSKDDDLWVVEYYIGERNTFTSEDFEDFLLNEY